MDNKYYIKKYKKIYADVPEKSAKKRDELIIKLADVLTMMDDCKAHIEEEGIVTEMQQGSYSIMRESPWSRAYNDKLKLMTILLERLEKLLPDAKTEGVTKAGENLAKLITGSRPVEVR